MLAGSRVLQVHIDYEKCIGFEEFFSPIIGFFI